MSVVVAFLYTYVYFKVCLLACYCQVQEIYRFVGFVCRIEFYIIVNLVYLCINGVRLDFVVSYI